VNQYVLLHYGFVLPTPEIGEARGAWCQSISEHIVDSGKPLGPERENTNDGTNELPLAMDSITGYMIISAQDMDAATAIAATCPSIASIRVYPAIAM